MLTVITSRNRLIKGKCSAHPRREAVAMCVVCRRKLCRGCLRISAGRTYCRKHIEEIQANFAALGKEGHEVVAASLRINRVAFWLAVFGGWFGLPRFYLGRRYSGAATALATAISVAAGLTLFGWEWANPDAGVLVKYVKYAFLIACAGGGVCLFITFFAVDFFNSRGTDVAAGVTSFLMGDQRELPIWAGMIFTFVLIVLVTLAIAGVGRTELTPMIFWRSLFIVGSGCAGVVWLADVIALTIYEMTDGDGLPMF